MPRADSGGGAEQTSQAAMTKEDQPRDMAEDVNWRIKELQRGEAQICGQRGEGLWYRHGNGSKSVE